MAYLYLYIIILYYSMFVILMLNLSVFSRLKGFPTYSVREYQRVSMRSTIDVVFVPLIYAKALFDSDVYRVECTLERRGEGRRI